MASHLVIVESPAKAKTIKRYLGKDFQVLASYGHVRDLRPRDGAVDTEHDFKMHYEIIEKNKKHVDAIDKALRKADVLYLATDPDREGEAISWHLYELLRERGSIGEKPVHRVVFHEITESAIREAIANPEKLSTNLIDAQQARRALDYLVGFNLSPLLWRKIAPGLSAGRVQSPALRMIAEREMEIEAFNPQEYWTIEADLESDGAAFTAKLSQLGEDKVKQFTLTDTERAGEVREMLLAAAGNKLVVSNVEKKQRKRNPAPPFMTSTLQQEAVRKLGFTAKRAMRIAQQLYEGIDIGDGAVGLITYMRTDSLSMARVAVDEIRAMVAERYGKDKIPAQPREYKTKSKNAQEAHEAIRPTSARYVPQDIKASLSEDQFKLYRLIWNRAVACQMIHATIDTVSADLAAGDKGSFRATGSTIADPGFMLVYQEGVDDKKSEDDEKMLPVLTVGDEIELREIRSEQHFTEPPPRFTEASLVKTLEEYGIGRPSTYASIISTLQNREYVTLDKKRFQPTDVGRVVNRFLTEHFRQYVDYDFTARLEDELDAVSRGEESWLPLMRNFWEPFKKLIEDGTDKPRPEGRLIGTDPKSGKPVSVRVGRYGAFVQIGTRDDEDKPKFAGLRPGQSMDTITMDEAMELFKLPRELGETPEGEPVQVNIGRFGPYVKFGSKYASLGEEDDPYTVTRERALEVVAEKKAFEANRIIQTFEASEIEVLRGRYGPYVTDGNKNARIPKGREPESLTLAECEQLIAEAPERRSRGSKKKAAAKKKTTGKASKKKTGKKTAKKKAAKKTSAGEEAARAEEG